MTAYRRNLIPGGSFFFTVNLLDRRSDLLTQRIDLLRQAFSMVRERHPFILDAVVILPDHLHAIWTLPPGDADYATRWRMIKAEFSRGSAVTERRSASRRHKGERGIWQRRYWEHTLRDDATMSATATTFISIRSSTVRSLLYVNGHTRRSNDMSSVVFIRSIGRAGTMMTVFLASAVDSGMMGIAWLDPSYGKPEIGLDQGRL